MLSSQTKMVQHIRKKHPEFAQLANTIHTPLTTAVISSAPAVISADGTTAEAVVVRKSYKRTVHAEHQCSVDLSPKVLHEINMT